MKYASLKALAKGRNFREPSKWHANPYVIAGRDAYVNGHRTMPRECGPCFAGGFVRERDDLVDATR